MNKLIRTNQSKIRSCVGFSVYINASRPNGKVRAGGYLTYRAVSLKISRWRKDYLRISFLPPTM